MPWFKLKSHVIPWRDGKGGMPGCGGGNMLSAACLSCLDGGLSTSVTFNGVLLKNRTGSQVESEKLLAGLQSLSVRCAFDFQYANVKLPEL